MKQVEVIRILFAITALLLGVVLFRFSTKVKAREQYSKYICYSGFISFIIGAVFVYFSDIVLSSMISIILFCIGAILIFIGYKKDS